MAALDQMPAKARGTPRPPPAPPAFADSREHPTSGGQTSHDLSGRLAARLLRVSPTNGCRLFADIVHFSTALTDGSHGHAVAKVTTLLNGLRLSYPRQRYGASAIVTCVAIPSSRRRRSSNVLRKAALSVLRRFLS